MPLIISKQQNDIMFSLKYLCSRNQFNVNSLRTIFYTDIIYIYENIDILKTFAPAYVINMEPFQIIENKSIQIEYHGIPYEIILYCKK